MKKVSGQALFNGIMINSTRSIVLIRKPDGILIEKRNNINYSNFKIPVLRFIIQFFKLIFISFRANIFSFMNLKSKSPIIFIIGILILYILYPYIINVNKLPISINIIDLLTLCLILIIVYKNQVFKDMLKYHGAEHKVIHCYENDYELTIDNVRQFPKEHQRCGTTYVSILIIFTIILETIIYLIPFNLSIITYTILFILTFGISFEFAQFIQNRRQKKFYSLFIKIGLTMQKFTTKEPDDNHIETAIEALKRAI